jgi:hypothetical protein
MTKTSLPAVALKVTAAAFMVGKNMERVLFPVFRWVGWVSLGLATLLIGGMLIAAAVGLISINASALIDTRGEGGYGTHFGVEVWRCDEEVTGGTLCRGVKWRGGRVDYLQWHSDTPHRLGGGNGDIDK